MQNNKSTSNLLLRRLAAFLYDCLLLIAIYFVVTAAIIPLNSGEAIQHWSFKIFLVFIAFIFFDWFWRHGGQTLGMRAWRIRVEGIEHEKITFNQSVQRFMVGLFMFGITFAFMYGKASSQALHDTLSKTIIVMYYK